LLVRVKIHVGKVTEIYGVWCGGLYCGETSIQFE
jgi:hypothetical protein